MIEDLSEVEVMVSNGITVVRHTVCDGQILYSTSTDPMVLRDLVEAAENHECGE